MAAIAAGPMPKEFGIYHSRLRRFLDGGHFSETNITSRILRAGSMDMVTLEMHSVSNVEGSLTFAQAIARPFTTVEQGLPWAVVLHGHRSILRTFAKVEMGGA
jgi:hypothetical protein